MAKIPVLQKLTHINVHVNDDAHHDLVSDGDDASHVHVSEDANVNHDDDGDYDDAGHPCILGRKRIQL